MAKETIEILKKTESDAELAENIAKTKAAEIVENARKQSEIDSEKKISQAKDAAEKLLAKANMKINSQSEQSDAVLQNNLSSLKDTALKNMDDAANAVVRALLD